MPPGRVGVLGQAGFSAYGDKLVGAIKDFLHRAWFRMGDGPKIRIDNAIAFASQAEAEYEQICPEGPGPSVAFTHAGGPISFTYDITKNYAGFTPGNGPPNPVFFLFRVS
jgi:hypothetical protein